MFRPASRRLRPGRRLLAPDVAYGPLGVLTIAAGVFGLSYLAVVLAPPDNGVAAWWPAAGLATIALMWAPRDRRAVVVASVVIMSALANLAVGRPWHVALGYGASNALESAVVAALLTRRGRPRLATLDDLFRLVGATAAGVLVMGVGAGLTQLLADGAGFLVTARTVVASHGAALLLTLPLGMRAPGGTGRAGRLEAAAQLAAVCVAIVVIFRPGQGLPVSFLTMPLLVWGALRFGVKVVSVELIVVALLVTSFSRFDGGPFAAEFGATSTATASLVQAYLVCCALVTLPLAVSIAQRRAALARSEASERLFRQGFRDSLVGMAMLRLCDGAHGPGEGAHAEGGLDVVQLNDVAARMLAGDPAALVGAPWTALLAEPDRHELAARVREMLAGTSEGWHGEVAVATPAGDLWVDVALSPLAASAGENLFVAQMVDVTARRAAEERLTAQAQRDSLTGLANRSRLHGEIDAAVAALPPDEADGGPGVAVLFCDLDDFKDVNDSAGHTEGDRVLVRVAERLRTLLGPDDLAARLGGDEFVVLRRCARDRADVEQLASAVLAGLSAPIVVGGHGFTVGVSIGIAWGGPGASADDLLRDADAAMYAAKAGGKRRAVTFSDEHRARAVRAVRVEAELRRALELGQLEMYLQPVVDLRDGATVAAEALVRWRHPERGLLEPGAWLDVAEACGLMPELGAWILRRSCELAAAWPQSVAEVTPAVHVNVSARQLEVPGFVADVHRVLAETGLPPARLVLEFTETQLDTVSEALLADLATLRRAGIGLAADDFGTGYSPLTRIIELPISMVKVDQRFVAGMLDDVRSQAIVTTLVRLTDSLGLALVAEGVETQEQAQALQMLGCTAGQGFLWSRPVPADVFHERLRGAVLR
ncbi:EAL domain-containing protein [Actinotalea sp. JY-7885]|uniref:bifunctional diguanylate cyclase/phosphodiesterase n=1 Tax=Actinotalea sp. JY-7885 TaxID=2758576 RepID=UPI00165E21A5|nr:EAL domain-containing protein [Actinotalea sp. JY-7885]